MCTCIQFTLTLSLTIIVMFAFVQATQHVHILYNMKNANRINVGICSKSSPEIFFHHVAQPSLSILYLRSKAFFGILMDKMESSSFDSETDRGNETREQWEFITKTVSVSLDSAIDRVETSWNYFITLHEVQPLPWEKHYKTALLHDDALYQLEYSYTMVEAVIRSGTKEIVGTLQHQLTSVIRKLEMEVSAKKDEQVTEQTLFKEMKRALARMKPSFTTKLLEKVVDRALNRYHSSKTQNTSSSQQKTFVSEVLDEMAILLHAFREKGKLVPNFWYEMSQIFKKEFNVDDHSDDNEIIVNLMRDLSNQDVFTELIVQIISRDNKINA